MDLSQIWLIIVSDGDIDYTNVYVAEGAKTEMEAQTILDEIVGEEEDPDDSYFYRVIPLESFKDFKKRIKEDEDFD